MNAHAPPPADTAPDAAAPCGDRVLERARPLIERQLAVLGRLAEVGLEIALALEQQAKGGAETPVVQGDIALAYSRVARAVRLTIALQSKLIEDLQALETGAAMQALRAEAEEDNAAWDQDELRKADIEQVILRAVRAEHPDEDTVDRLIIEAGERLDGDTLYGDVLSRPMSEIIALICRDLGLSPDWSRLAEEAWAREEIEDGEIGWPLETFTGPVRPPPLAGGLADRIRSASTAQRAGGGIPPPLASSAVGTDGTGSMPPQSLRDSSHASGGAVTK